MFLIYYGVLSLLFTMGASVLNNEGYTSNINLNDTELTNNEIDNGGLFSTGISFSRFFLFVGFGIGLPGDTPAFFSIIFLLWQTMITVLFIGFIISSMWNG